MDMKQPLSPQLPIWPIAKIIQAESSLGAHETLCWVLVCGEVPCAFTSLAIILLRRELPLGYKTFFMLNSAEHKIDPAHKC